MTKKKLNTKQGRKACPSPAPEAADTLDGLSIAELLAAAYPDDEARDNAAHGFWRSGSLLDSAFDLAGELGVTIFHPEVFPHVLKVLLREALPSSTERVANKRKWLEAHRPSFKSAPRPWMLRADLRRMARAARRAGGAK